MTSSFIDTTSFLVYGQVSGRHRGAFAFTSGNTVVTFTPNTAFKKGEVATVDLTNKIRTSSDVHLIPSVSQFTLTSNCGTGDFTQTSTPSAGTAVRWLGVGDVD